METIREQIAMGRHCVHGTAVGTPGGADLMCGRCEDGATRWVPTPLHSAAVTTTIVGGDSQTAGQTTITFPWALHSRGESKTGRWLRTSDPSRVEAWAEAIAAEVQGWSEEGCALTWVTVTTTVEEDGYWDVPTTEGA